MPPQTDPPNLPTPSAETRSPALDYRAAGDDRSAAARARSRILRGVALALGGSLMVFVALFLAMAAAMQLGMLLVAPQDALPGHVGWAIVILVGLSVTSAGLLYLVWLMLGPD